jgi:hypothetical protein
MAVTSFNVDAKLDETLESLKSYYGASSKAEVLRKAIALLKVAQESEQQDGELLIRQGGREVKVLVK